MASTVVKHIVVDSGGFIRNAPIREIGENVYTVPKVVHESCDKATRKRLQVLPYTLHFKTPSADAVLKVSEFAKKTGDYRHLSVTDIEVLALTYMLEKEHVGLDHIKTEPDVKPIESVVPSSTTGAGQAQIAGFYNGAKVDDETIDDEMIGDEKIDDEKIDDEQDEDEEEQDDQEEEEEEDDDDDDDEGWITPSNIKSVLRQMGGAVVETEPQAKREVACLTTDFAMQNVLIQMGLAVVSVDGLMIKRASSYVLRCTACFKVTYNLEKVFCPHCGNKTLKRVAVEREADGSLRFFFSRKPLNLKGKKYPLPKPEGGKHGNNPVLVEDQPMPQQRMPRKALQKVDIFDPDFVEGSSPFAVNDVTSRAAQIGLSGKHDFRRQAYWNKRNPNEPRKRYGKKKAK